ncbi:alpha/beta hydrolase [Victivallis vadensis]|uniref:Alpha/beta hydrolase n=1 Tax=Victivallis vadensis TaxID=172901 RepID=A0A848B093_9BACT|nr:alpha/beta hydrolase [Victivallis vadensis]NMD89275.1 alpha/beta hydrolase [Victivallis vadensis]
MQKIENFPLWSSLRPALNRKNDFEPYMNCYLLDDDKIHGAVIIFPGGGYQEKMMSYEGEDVALKFNTLGFHTFVVNYRCGRDAYLFPAPQEDALRSIKLVRGHAEEWNIDPGQIAAAGFSAGGHLACCTATMFDAIRAENGDCHDAVSARPDAVILCYAVVSAFAGNNRHLGSFRNLLNTDHAAESTLHELSCEKHVRPDSPPAFIWHTAADQIVSWENAIRLAEAYKKQHLTFELHIYPYGPHGLGMGTTEEFAEVRSWPELAAVFLRKIPINSKQKS